MTEEILSTSFHSYPKSFALGHRLIKEIFLDEVIVEEKIDGSQFSFGYFDGELRCRSKGAHLNVIAPEKMFQCAVNTALALKDKARPGWTYRCEYLQKPKHNTLVYSRIPDLHIIGFDINTGHEEYMSYEDKAAHFAEIGLEVVPILFKGKVEDLAMFRALMETVSCLGGPKIEGVVVKNYKRFTPDGKAMMGKFVSEDFKEIHVGNWRESNPGNEGIIEKLVERYRTPARWAKAVQHMKELGLLEDSPKDIGKLIKESQVDIEKECKEEIKDLLYQWASGKVLRGSVSGIAEWYKDQLLKSSFDEQEANP